MPSVLPSPSNWQSSTSVAACSALKRLTQPHICWVCFTCQLSNLWVPPFSIAVGAGVIKRVHVPHAELIVKRQAGRSEGMSALTCGLLDLCGTVKTSKKSLRRARPIGIRHNGIRRNGHKSLHLSLNSQRTGEFPSPFLLPTSFLPLHSPSITWKYQKRRLNRGRNSFLVNTSFPNSNRECSIDREPTGTANIIGKRQKLRTRSTFATLCACTVSRRVHSFEARAQFQGTCTAVSRHAFHTKIWTARRYQPIKCNYYARQRFARNYQHAQPKAAH